MTYHVVVHSSESGYAGNELVMHAFVKAKNRIQDVLETARRLAKEHGNFEVSYYSIEQLPVDVGEGWLLFSVSRGNYWDQYEMQLVGSGGHVDLAKLEEYKRWRLTVDREGLYPDEVATRVLEAIEKLQRISVIRKYDFYLTWYGFHLRAELSRPVGFDEKMEMRRYLNDDYLRMVLDAQIKQLGFEGLADFLFNEKYMVQHGVTSKCNEETPLTAFTTVNLLGVLREFREHVKCNYQDCEKYYDYDVELATVELDTPEFSVRDGVLTFRKPADPDVAWTMVRGLLENPVKYVRDHILNSSKSIEEAVVKVYCGIASWKTCTAFTSLGARLSYDRESNTILVYLPELASRFAVHLMGEDGSRAKYVERLLGVRVRVVAENADEREYTKKLVSGKRAVSV